MQFSLSRPITAVDVVVVVGAALFLVLVGLVCMLLPSRLQRIALRAYEKANPRARWLSLPPEIIMSPAYAWNLRIGGFVAVTAGIVVLLVFIIAILGGVSPRKTALHAPPCSVNGLAGSPIKQLL